MSTSEFAFDPAVDYYRAFVVTLPTILRTPTTWKADQAGVVATFTPDLTAGETTTLATFMADISAMAKSAFTAQLTYAEYQTIKPFLASEQTWMAITRNAFVNMTDGDMRRAVYDIITAEVRIARAMRRD